MRESRDYLFSLFIYICRLLVNSYYTQEVLLVLLGILCCVVVRNVLGVLKIILDLAYLYIHFKLGHSALLSQFNDDKPLQLETNGSTLHFSAKSMDLPLA